jgi:hypothetical protein
MASGRCYSLNWPSPHRPTTPASGPADVHRRHSTALICRLQALQVASAHSQAVQVKWVRTGQRACRGCRELDDAPYKLGNGYGELSVHTIATCALHRDGVTEWDAHNLYGLAESVATAAAVQDLTGQRPFVLSRCAACESGWPHSEDPRRLKVDLMLCATCARGACKHTYQAVQRSVGLRLPDQAQPWRTGPETTLPRGRPCSSPLAAS